MNIIYIPVIQYLMNTIIDDMSNQISPIIYIK